MSQIPTPPEEIFRHAVYLGEGDSCFAWLINDGWVCRIAKHADAAAGLQHEACLLSRIAYALPLAIPLPVCYEALGRNIAIHPLIAGEPLTRKQFSSMESERRDRCTRQLAEFVAAFHRTDREVARKCGVELVDYPARYQEVRRNAERHLLPRLDQADRAYVRKVFREFLSAPRDPKTFVLLHGDISPDHVLWHPPTGQLIGILDFGDMQIGDPAWDLVFLFEDYGSEFVTLFLRHFAPDEAEELLARATRFMELDAIEWSASVSSGERKPEGEDCLAKITALRKLRA